MASLGRDPMIRRPQLVPWVRIEPIEGDGLAMISERSQWLLRDRAAVATLRLIDGQRSSEEIATLLAGQAPAAEVYFALGRLENAGYLVEADDAAADGVAFWRSMGAGVVSPGERLTGRVSVSTFGSVAASTVGQALQAYGLAVGDNADLSLVVADDYLDERLEAVNEGSLRTGRRWLLCKPAGTVLWLGPLFVPGQTGCLECLAHRLRANRPVEGFLQQRSAGRSWVVPPQLLLPSSQQTGLSMAATEIQRCLAGARSPLEGVLLTLDLATLQSDRHLLVRRPQCPRCGEPEYRGPRTEVPPVLKSSKDPGAGGRDGRVGSAEGMLARYGHHVSPLTGLVSDLRRVSEDGDIVSIYSAITARSPGSSDWRRPVSPSGGRGFTGAQARAGALCEALERHSARFQGYEPRVRTSYRDLRGGAIHPNDCMLFSDRQYAEREAWNERCSRLHFVPEPFDEACQLDWTPVWSLTRGGWRYLPMQYCFYDAPGENGKVYCRADSNGVAAGNCLEEAALYGIFELVERDAVALWWYNRVARPAVDIESFGDPVVTELLRYYRSRHRDVWALDLRADLGMPVFAAVSARNDGPNQELIFGFGAHLSARLALRQALGEMTQVLMPARRLGSMGQAEASLLAPELLSWLQTATLAGQPYLAADPTLPRLNVAAYPACDIDDPYESIQLCRRLVEARGLELLVLDQTRPDIGLPVARAVIPGLRHFWPRFAAGRLYDVPVQLAWLIDQTPEGRLNPTSIFL